ncbi:MAG: AAA family ATPase [Ignavibacterium sp.]|nr:AAA family ATPase [Ignavibacterium sp.]
MFNRDELEKTKKLLNSILQKNADASLKYAIEIFELIFGKNFSKEIDKNGVLRYRSLTGPEDNIYYFGVLYENAPLSGVYENFSLVVFPDNSNPSSQLLLCFGIGTGGITDDAELLAIPWIQRSITLLVKVIKKESWNITETRTFVKDNVTDDYSAIPEWIRNFLGNFAGYNELWRKYGKYLPSVCVINDSDEGAKAFLSHLILYAKFRDWPLLRNFEEIWQNKLLPEIMSEWRTYPSIEELSNYLLERKYLILQGPPGTGKTFLAEEIAKKLLNNDKISGYDIIQFHASVSYEDFIEGIRPDTNENQLIFRNYVGPLLKAINNIQDKKGYLLIIDEINRGDLAKILGEAIFLFEAGEERKITLKSGKEIKMPKNFYVIGTMNTADRTIAILDFAIRRRFAFIDIYPHSKQLAYILSNRNVVDEIKSFITKYFNHIQWIFFKYASSEELNLQPGHTYFIAETRENFLNRLKYEISPLLREYLNEGRLSLAKNEILAFLEQIENEAQD